MKSPVQTARFQWVRSVNNDDSREVTDPERSLLSLDFYSQHIFAGTCFCKNQETMTLIYDTNSGSYSVQSLCLDCKGEWSVSSDYTDWINDSISDYQSLKQLNNLELMAVFEHNNVSSNVSLVNESWWN